MKKIVCIVVVMILIGQPLIGQKFQLTEAATEYKNNFSPAWMLQPDKLEQNKSTLQKAKKAIDECYNKQLETPFTKPKDEAKMYYYRGMIYLDYTMMAAMDVEIMSELKTADEKSIQDASIGSLKKCMELDSRGEWKDQIQAKVNMLRSTMINGGVEMFKQENYEAAHQAFSGAVEIYSVLSIPDTLAMVNAALAAERNKDYDNAKKYYQMCADNNYGNGAEMYVSMIRVLSAKGDSGSNDEVLKVIESGIKRFPNDYTLNVEEFNYWYSNGDNTKAQAALQKAIESDPNNHILHFNIGVVFDNMSGSAHKAKNHDDAFLFMDKSIESYKSAIEIKPDYGDAYFNLGALYYNQSIEVQSLAQDLNGEEYDKQVARADQMMKDALPFLEKSHEISPKDVSTLTVLKSIYMNLSMEDKYKEADTKLKALGQ